MEKYKFFGFVGLGCGLLLLTGCGGGSSAHSLTCRQKTQGQDIKLEVKFNSNETKIEKSSMTITYDIPDGTSSDEIETAKNVLELDCSSGQYDKCTVNVEDKSLVMSIEGTSKSLSGIEESTSLKEAKEELEHAGYTCE